MKKMIIVSVALVAMAITSGRALATITCANDDTGTCKDTANPCDANHSAWVCCNVNGGACLCNGGRSS